MSISYYRKSRNYELFICKVFNCKKGKRYGADESFMMNLFLINCNEEYRNEQRVPSSRQFYKVKFYIEKALMKLKKRKKYIDSYNHFMPLLFKLDKAKCPDDLMEIVNQSFPKVIELENRLRRSG